MKSGGTIAGLPLAAGRALALSEEPPEKCIERSQKLDLDGHVDWLSLPFASTPTEEAWQELLDRTGPPPRAKPDRPPGDRLLLADRSRGGRGTGVQLRALPD